MTWWPWLAFPLGAYLLGSLSFAYWAGKLKGLDLRQHGSGNLGATNAGRVLGGRWFAIVFSLDVAKGLGPVLAARFLPPSLGWTADPLEQQLLHLATALAAVLGHVFTCWHGFKGGKAVATSLGVVIGLAPLLAAILFGTWALFWFIGAGLLRLGKSAAVGPASVLAALGIVPIRCALAPEPFGMAELPLTVFLIVLCAVIVLKHRRNIREVLRRGAGTGRVARVERGDRPADTGPATPPG